MSKEKRLPVLEVKKLTKKIDQKIIVDHLNFYLEAGDIYGFLEPKGSGKTTTLRIITRLVFPIEGEIFIYGLSISKEYKFALSSIGSIIENPAFYLNQSAAQSLKLSGKLSDPEIESTRINEVLALVGLSEVKYE
ncbi:ATP-binding cassette domain-containing protein [Candidatus Enterococcus mansonii]|uniref:ABC transporter domain-containing protein n=1 Tax=Candidatus Enterococcus mansonii TaxID=1834181 RepID=A0A242C6F5_9ENTE|nr:ATP-binding cassette domain-containing protein [Enterococcus sp. 4G2_DIV0659]OTO05688.1 hypothetical protein A5880_002863 [Enterococcus sp. 4G2_DIV0659]